MERKYLIVSKDENYFREKFNWFGVRERVRTALSIFSRILEFFYPEEDYGLNFAGKTVNPLCGEI